MNNPNVLYKLMMECIDYGEYNLAMEYAIRLDEMLQMKYYTTVIENLMVERDNFVRKIGKGE